MRYSYSVTSALLITGSVIALVTGNPVTAQTTGPVTLAQSSLAPRGAPASFADLAEKLQPAVVNIATKKKVKVVTGIDLFTGRPRAENQDQASGGSGFIISADGYIVTNNHVVVGGQNNEAVDSVTVTLFGGKEYSAEIVGRDPQSDVALLKIKATDLPYVAMGDSRKSRVGDWVVAIGNPLGLGSTVTAGIVSALQRNIGAGGAYDRFIQTDTAINPGNSGGPLFNLDGQVVGINNRLISPSGANIGVGFAIPVDEVVPVIESLKKGIRPERGYLGIGIEPVDEQLADALGLAKNRGEMVTRVQPGDAASKAGVKEGDIVLKVAGTEITPEKTLSYIVANIKPGTKIALDILREGKPSVLNATVGKRPTDEELAKSNFNPGEQKQFRNEGESSEDTILRDAFGISVIVLDAQIARDLGLTGDVKGLVVDIAGDGSGARAGLRRADVIVSANYKAVATTAALTAIIKEAKAAGRGAVLIGVKRGNQRTIYATVKLGD